MDEYLEELFDKDCRDKTHDILQEYRTNSVGFVSNFELYLDFLIENIDLNNFWLVAGTCLNRIFETIHDLDVDEIQNWKEFIKSLTDVNPHFGVKIENSVIKRDHRKPPKPKHYHTAQRGYCRYCGEMIIKENGVINRRKHWHDVCVAEYNVIYNAAEMRRVVYERDKGICKHCGVVDESPNGSWEADHILRLRESNGNIEYFKINNVQTLCKLCHKDKTSKEILYHKDKKNG